MAEEALALPEDPTEAWSGGTPGRSLLRGRAGWRATLVNIKRALASPGWWRRIAYDSFRDELVWCEWGSEGAWRRWTDEDSTRCRIALETAGFEPVGRELMRDAVNEHARDRVFDSAQLWLSRLRWDEVGRVDGFLERYCGARADGAGNGAYLRAVSRYLWTALAGRVIVPGVQADMVPILIGKGGLRKTALVRALVPAPEFACRVDLNMRDDDLARRLRGRLVGEVAELRGLHTRDQESIKDWVSAVEDTWTPKYREFATRVGRRFVLVGTTDKPQFLADEAGNNRRWLPVTVGGDDGQDLIDTDAVRRDCEQLWAEAAVLFAEGGVAWQDAQALAAPEHTAHMLEDSWEEALEEWIDSLVVDDLSTGLSTDAKSGVGATWGDVGFTTRRALTGANLVGPTSSGRGSEMRCARILRALGFEKGRDKSRGGQRDARKWRFTGANLV